MGLESLCMKIEECLEIKTIDKTIRDLEMAMDLAEISKEVVHTKV